jgi:hypothetical protein
VPLATSQNGNAWILKVAGLERQRLAHSGRARRRPCPPLSATSGGRSFVILDKIQTQHFVSEASQTGALQAPARCGSQRILPSPRPRDNLPRQHGRERQQPQVGAIQRQLQAPSIQVQAAAARRRWAKCRAYYAQPYVLLLFIGIAHIVCAFVNIASSTRNCPRAAGSQNPGRVHGVVGSHPRPQQPASTLNLTGRDKIPLTSREVACS